MDKFQVFLINPQILHLSISKLDRGQLGTGIVGVYGLHWKSLIFINIMNILKIKITKFIIFLFLKVCNFVVVFILFKFGPFLKFWLLLKKNYLFEHFWLVSHFNYLKNWTKYLYYLFWTLYLLSAILAEPLASFASTNEIPLRKIEAI